MITSYVSPYYIGLTDGYYMIRRASESAIAEQWRRMSPPQIDEFETLYGKDKAFEGFRNEVLESDNVGVIYKGRELIGMMFSATVNYESLGLKNVRCLGQVCTDYCLKHSIDFCKHCKECRDAFLLFEPSRDSDIYVFIKDSFRSSKEWAVRVCGFHKVGEAFAGEGEKFSIYKHSIGED